VTQQDESSRYSKLFFLSLQMGEEILWVELTFSLKLSTTVTELLTRAAW
jgi:hypothetical protein